VQIGAVANSAIIVARADAMMFLDPDDNLEESRVEETWLFSMVEELAS
jgi:hypothetical protein